MDNVFYRLFIYCYKTVCCKIRLRPVSCTQRYVTVHITRENDNTLVARTLLLLVKIVTEGRLLVVARRKHDGLDKNGKKFVEMDVCNGR